MRNLKSVKNSLETNWLNISEASTFLGISKDTLRRWEKHGKLLPRRTAGRHRRYHKQELEKLLNQSYVVSAKASKLVPPTISIPTSSPHPSLVEPSIPSKKLSFKPKLSRYDFAIIISLIVLITIAITTYILFSNAQQPTIISPLPTQ